jgi:S-adenosylmethionine hydrolase
MACITLLSDFGLQDASVAIAKGVLLQYLPQTPILDISHEVTPFNTRQAAYLLASASNNFPPATCHILLFDVFSGTPSRLLLTEHNRQYFLSADNGVIPLAFGNIEKAWMYFEMNGTQTYIAWVNAAGHAANLLQTNRPEKLGLPPYQLRALAPVKPQLPAEDTMECEVMHIDHFGNTVLNITKPRFAEAANNRPFRVQFKHIEDIDTISSSYADVREGFKLLRFNSNSFLEICINHGNAAKLFGLRLGSKHNDIKILFE